MEVESRSSFTGQKSSFYWVIVIDWIVLIRRMNVTPLYQMNPRFKKKRIDLFIWLAFDAFGSKMFSWLAYACFSRSFVKTRSIIVNVYLRHIFRCFNFNSKSPPNANKNQSTKNDPPNFKKIHPLSSPHFLILLPQKLGVSRPKPTNNPRT